MAEGAARARRQVVRLLGNQAVMAAAGASLITGFAQFTAVAALGDVAAAFGERHGDAESVAAAAGLSFTALGVGLATIRLASLVGLPLAALGDRLGRRATLLGLLAVGLALTAAAATSQGFWWFVVLLALARPGLSAGNAVAGVIAAEETDAVDRSAAMAAVTVGYGVGSGSVVLIRAAFADTLGFRGLFALALVLLVLGLPLLWRVVPEPARYARLRDLAAPEVGPGAGARVPVPDLAGAPAPPGPGLSLAVGGLGVTGLTAPWRAGLGRRLGALAVTTLGLTFAASPATGLLFVYGENVVGVSPAVIGSIVAATVPVGAAGLLVGRWGADHLGRRVTAGAAQMVLAAAVAVTYSGELTGLIGGYLTVLFATSAYTPPAGALAAELFPTRVRATAAGWLTVAGTLGAVAGLITVGLVSDALDSPLGGMIAVAVPSAAVALAFALVPETRGQEVPD